MASSRLSFHTSSNHRRAIVPADWYMGPSGGHCRIVSRAAARSSERGGLEAAMRRVKRGRYLLIPASEATHGHSTHTWAAVWEKELRAFLKDVTASAWR